MHHKSARNLSRCGLEQVEREALAKAARADIESYNAYIAEHGLFADMLRDQEQGDPRDAEPV